MVILNALDTVVVLAVGLITGLVAWRVLREHPFFDKIAAPIAVCGAILAGLGLLSTGPDLLFIGIPWTALGLALLAMFLLAEVMRVLNWVYTIFARTKEAWATQERPSTRGWTSPEFGHFSQKQPEHERQIRR